MSTDDDLDIDDIDTLVFFESKFSLVRVVDGVLVPSRIKLRADLIPASDVTEEAFDFALAKIRYFLDAVLTRCVAFSREDEAAFALMFDGDGRRRAGNLIMLCPETPTDGHLAALLQAKLTALANGVMVFGPVELRSDNVAGLGFAFIGHHADVLPDMQNWVGERHYFEQPWWARDDGSTHDSAPAEDADLTDLPDYAYSLDFLREDTNTEPVVVRRNFRPHVIDGGST